VESDAVLVRFAPCARNETPMSSFGPGQTFLRLPRRNRLFHGGFLCRVFSWPSGVSDFMNWTCWRGLFDEHDLRGRIRCRARPLRSLRAERTPISFFGPGQTSYWLPRRNRLFHGGFLCRVFSGPSGVSDFIDWTCWRGLFDEDDLRGRIRCRARFALQTCARNEPQCPPSESGS